MVAILSVPISDGNYDSKANFISTIRNSIPVSDILSSVDERCKKMVLSNNKDFYYAWGLNSGGFYDNSSYNINTNSGKYNMVKPGDRIVFYGTNPLRLLFSGTIIAKTVNKNRNKISNRWRCNNMQSYELLFIIDDGKEYNLALTEEDLGVDTDFIKWLNRGSKYLDSNTYNSGQRKIYESFREYTD